MFLNVKGRASHAGSAPEEGRNAVTELAHQLRPAEGPGRSGEGNDGQLDRRARDGDKRNIIPAQAAAEGDMRYSDLSEYDRVLADGKRLIGNHLIPDTEVEFRIEKGRPPLVKNPGSDRLAGLAREIYAKTGRDLKPVAMRFGTDAGYAYDPKNPKPADPGNHGAGRRRPSFAGGIRGAVQHRTPPLPDVQPDHGVIADRNCENGVDVLTLSGS